MMLLKLTAVKKLSAVWLKTATISTSATMTGPLPRLPERRLAIIRPGYEAIPVGSSGGGASTSGSLCG